MNNCLILVDLQNDYFPGGAMELVGIQSAAANAQILLNEFRKTKAPVIHIQHISAHPGATFFLPDTDGAKINQMITPRRNETVVVKNYPNAFRNTSLGRNSEERKHLQPGDLRSNEPHVHRRNHSRCFRLGIQLCCGRRCLRHKGLGFQRKNHKGVRGSWGLHGSIVNYLCEDHFYKRNCEKHEMNNELGY